MARPLRIEYPNAFYHITFRGNERRPIFRSKGDYERLLETPRANLQRTLHYLNTSYTNYFNAKTRRVCHLFQGRYRAILVERDVYALELSTLFILIL